MEKRRFTMQSQYRVTERKGTIYVPTVTISGKWLEEQGFNIGSKFEVIQGKNMLVLVKIPNYVVEEETRLYQITKLKHQLNQLEK